MLAPGSFSRSARDGLEVAGVERYRCRVAGCLVNARRRGDAFGNADDPGRRADAEVAAGHLAAGKESLVAVRCDELQGMRLAGSVTHWHHERTIMHADAVRLDAFARQVRMIRTGRRGGLPELRRLARGLGVARLRVGLALFAHLLHALGVRSMLNGRQFAANVHPPRLRQVGAPAAEGAGRDTVGVQRVPAAIVAALAVAGEAPQSAVGLDHVWRIDAGRDDGSAELLGRVHHVHVSTRAPRGSNISAVSGQSFVNTGRRSRQRAVNRRRRTCAAGARCVTG